MRRWRWFENCLGALDETHCDCLKGHISTNVLGVCNQNMRFTYILPGWERSASDSQVLKYALTRGNRLVILTGYTNGPSFLVPYRRTRYHLKEWVGNRPGIIERFSIFITQKLRM